MITITYNVGNTEYKKSFSFDYALSEEAFDKAFADSVDVFKRVHQLSNVNTLEVVESNVKAPDTHKEVKRNLGLGTKPIKTAPVEMDIKKEEVLNDTSTASL